ncbi:MAG: hypothetical protein MJ069_08240 [Salinivirgaceae bacterium]|nr:hypothetical protein [Salinivirgaceae bacterium]
MKLRIVLASALCASMFFTANAQQRGISYYVNTDATYINTKVSNVIAQPDNSLLVVSKCSDLRYRNHAIQLIGMNKEGVRTLERLYPVENLYDVVGATTSADGKVSVFSSIETDKLENYTLQLSASLNKLGEVTGAHESSFILISTYKKNDNQILQLVTETSKGENCITLACVDATGNQLWIKKVSSETNESADAMVVDAKGDVIIAGKKYSDTRANEYVPVIYKTTADGTVLWKKSGFDMPANFYTQSITVNPQGEIFHICHAKNAVGTSQTKVSRLNPNGDVRSSSSINDFSANGIIWLSSKKLLLFGSCFYVDARQVVTKGSYVILDEQLSVQTHKTLESSDKPDSDFDYNFTSSSDLQAAVEMKNGSIALVGKVFMPRVNEKSEKINNTILIVADAYGNYK